MSLIKTAVKELIRKVEKARVTVADSEHRLFTNEMNARIRRESFEFINERMPRASYFPRGWKQMFDYISASLQEGLLLEFGVYQGQSINYLASKTSRTIHGFDSFVGFPENYIGHVTSKFDCQGKLPKVKHNVKLYPGYFEDTLPKFVKEHPNEKVAFMHIDCDIYSSTKTVFHYLGDRIEDTLVQFDELYNYWCWKEHEIKAFDEFLKENPDITCEYIGFYYRQVLVRLKRSKGK